jgi:hypothetical protein
VFKIKPKFMVDENKKKRGVFITLREFNKLIDLLEDYQDYLFVKNYKRDPRERLYTLEEVKSELNK